MAVECETLTVEVRAPPDMTSNASILQGPFHFYRPETSDFRRLFPAAEVTLPAPHPIYLTDESSTPFSGFPLLISPLLESLNRALASYVRAETRRLTPGGPGATAEPSEADTAWKKYAEHLTRITVDATSSSYGRQYLSVFWLYHSGAVAEVFHGFEEPEDVAPGRATAQLPVRYRVLQHYLSSVAALTRAAVARVGERLEEPTVELYPTLLSCLERNVLIVSEISIDPDLRQLDRYLGDYRGIDPADFRGRLERLRSWHRSQNVANPELERVARHLLAEGADGEQLERDVDRRLCRPGYVAYLSAMETYDSGELLSPEQVIVWEDLLDRLKEFEILTAWRRLIVPVRKSRGQLLVSDPPPADSTDGVQIEGGPLAASTHALDFSTSWVVDPIVHRYGLLYDMTHFSETVSALGRLQQQDQETSFRAIFEFQRWTNRLAADRRGHLEKYLGDGAFYSARTAESLLAVAIRLQRRYAALVSQGFPLDQGIRMALNFGSYRLIPLDTGGQGGSQRFEFLGQGIVELTRLISGKSKYDLREIRALLIDRGLAEEEIDRMLGGPLNPGQGTATSDEIGDRFSAHIDSDGRLTNEGIVATSEFIDRLGRHRPHDTIEHQSRSWALVDILDGVERLRIGIRRLGLARLKGLEEMAIYQVADAAGWSGDRSASSEGRSLLETLDDDRTRPSGTAKR